MMSAISQRIGMIFGALYFTLAITAHANSLNIQTEFWEHQLRKDLFHSGGSVQNLNSGFKFGIDKYHETSLPLKGSATSEALKEEYELLIGSLKKQNKTLNEEKNRLKGIMSQKSFEIPEKEEEKEKEEERVAPETHEDQEEPAALSFDWEQFRKCAQETLPSIKKLIQGEVQIENPSPSRQDPTFVRASLLGVRQDVQQNRGNGSQGGTPEGVACGRFLGTAGFVSGSLKEDAKILAAISSREEEEARLLTKTLVASHHVNFARDNPEAFQQWRYFWNELSVKAVFSRDPLPLMSVFEELRVGDLGEVFRESILKYTQEGLAFAEGKLR